MLSVCKCNVCAEKGESGRKDHVVMEMFLGRGFGVQDFERREEEDDVEVGLSKNGSFYVTLVSTCCSIAGCMGAKETRRGEVRKEERGQGGGGSLLWQRNSSVLQHWIQIVSILHFFFTLDSIFDESSSINTICFPTSDS